MVTNYFSFFQESVTKCATETTYKPGPSKSALSKIFKSKPLLLRLANCSFCWYVKVKKIYIYFFK